MAGILSPELLQELSDLGILVSIGLIVVIFVVKILDFLLTQAKTVNNSISPKMNMILDMLTTMKTEIIGTVTAHNTSANGTFLRILNILEDLKEEVEKIEEDNERIIRNQELILSELRFLNSHSSNSQSILHSINTGQKPDVIMVDETKK